MEQVLLVREAVVRLFKRFETVILFTCRLLFGLLIFSVINGIGYPLPQFAKLFAPPYALPFVTLMGVLFAICPITVSYGIIIVNIGLQVSGAPGVALFVVLFMLCVMFFYIRIAPKESALILATYFAFMFNVPYAVPLVAGLYCGVTSVIPITIGIFVWESVPVLGKLLETASVEEISLLELPALCEQAYRTLYEGINGNEDWVFTAFIFAMVVIVVFAIARTGINYAKDLAVLIGGSACAVGFLMAAIMAGMDIDLFYVIMVTVFSIIITEIIQFFDIVLDYQHAELVHFEDETNYYIVKVIPKVVTIRHRKTPKRSETPQVREKYREEYQADYREEYSEEYREEYSEGYREEYREDYREK